MRFYLKRCQILREISGSRVLLTLNFLLASCIFFTSCNDYPVYYSTTIESKIEILGKEKCHQEEDKNFWILNIVTTTGSKKIIGLSATFNGGKYQNIVKTNYDMAKLGNKEKKYYIITGDEITSSPYPCSMDEKEILPSFTNKIPTITITKIDSISRGF